MSMASMMMSTLLASASSAPSLTSKTSYSSRNAQRRPTTCQRQWRLGSLSIRSSSDKNGEESPLIKMDIQNIDGVLKPEEIPDYQIPSFTTLRKRKPARKMSIKEVIKLVLAISKMKDLDPWSFVQQANIRCAFFNGAYDQVGFDKVSLDRCNNVQLQVHSSSLFLPWHRWYIYFFERILGKLIGDESFALPYWDYDHRDGMVFPEIYDVPFLLDEKRDDHARAGKDVENYVDLRYSLKKYAPPDSIDKLVEGNLCYLQRIFKEGANDPKLFIGETPEAGQGSAVAGSLENLHNVVHQWVGKRESPNFDMGNFITAARDPLFYAHHMNVDRLWEIFRTQFMKMPNFETNNPDWLEASFIFYDENRRVVKVKVRDALNIEKLGYSYDDMSVQWKDVKCTVTLPQAIIEEGMKEFRSMPSAFDQSPNIRADESPIRGLIERPKSSRQMSAEIEKTVEVLIVDGIEVVQPGSTRFDVYISTPETTTDIGYFAGSFITVSHGHKHGKTADSNAKKLTLKLGITNLVAELHAETAKSLRVTLVPRTGRFLIDRIHIEQNEIK